jgi:hypothetical protein
MKKILFLTWIALTMIGSQITTMAQAPATSNRQRLNAEQIIQKRTAQMVQTLMLDDETAARFTPVYTQYLKDKMACRITKKQVKGQQKGMKSEMTDAEAENVIKDRFAQSHKILDIQEKYYNQFRRILTPKQILRIYQNEKATREGLRKEMKRRNLRKGMMMQNNQQQDTQQN